MVLAKTILALDPGDRNLGWAFSDGTHGTYVTEKKWNAWQRCDWLTRTLFKQFGHSLQSDDSVVIIEDGYRRAALIKLVGMLAGVFSTRCQVIIPKPSQWPAELFGKQHAGNYKKCALTHVKKPSNKTNTQHEADAICMIDWYRKFYKPNT